MCENPVRPTQGAVKADSIPGIFLYFLSQFRELKDGTPVSSACGQLAVRTPKCRELSILAPSHKAERLPQTSISGLTLHETHHRKAEV